jgi:hypothetical protein
MPAETTGYGKRLALSSISLCMESELQVLLAMQKVEGSNPFSRSLKACTCRPFSWAQSAAAGAAARGSPLGADSRRDQGRDLVG